MKDDINVKDALSIDKFGLDTELVRQAHLYEQAISKLSDVTYERDRAKAKLDYAKATLATNVRANWNEYNAIGNCTDAKVKDIVTCDEEISRLEKIYHEWEAEVTAADGYKWALDHKKVALKELSRLFLAGYFVEPYIGSDKPLNNDRMAKRKKSKE